MSNGPIQQDITTKLIAELSPVTLEVVNESHLHSVPANSETHFKVTLVSEAFEGLRPVQRHQKVYQILAVELEGEVHALALHLYTPEQWRALKGQSPESPACLGGSKADQKS
ncbi:MAG TPA: BolA/IbaG family iron-sulfur metabolism protein [Marinagarivorans sp.]